MEPSLSLLRHKKTTKGCPFARGQPFGLYHSYRSITTTHAPCIYFGFPGSQRVLYVIIQDFQVFRVIKGPVSLLTCFFF